MKKLWYQICQYVSNNFRIAKLRIVHEVIAGHPYDSSYLLHLEKYKLKEMLDYFKRSNITDHTHNIKWIQICLNLLDIIIEEPEVDPNTINTRNCLRFAPYSKAPVEDIIDYYKRWPNDLRWLKANHLYYEIRKQYTSHWRD